MKKENGSIAIFALIALLFMTAFLIISYANIINNSKSLKEQFNIIKGIYYKSNDSSSYTDVYTNLRKKNRQNLTAYSENSNELELNKTFASKLVNYKIYGNSVQDGTPTPDNPVEIESVGITNLLTFQNSTASNSGVELSVENDKFTINGTATSTVLLSFFNNLCIADDITLSAGTYTISVQGTGTVTDNGNFLQVWKVDGDSLTNAGQIGLNKNVTFALEETQTIRLRVIVYSGRSYDATFNIQMEKCNTVTPYAPYGKYKIPIKVSNENDSKITNIILDEPLRKVGEAADYIDFKSGQVVRNVGVNSDESLYSLDTSTEKNIELPELPSYEDYTKIEVLTEIAPSKIEVEYDGYTITE